MIIKRKYVVLQTLFENDRRSNQIFANVCESFDNYSRENYSELLERIFDRRLYELENTDEIRQDILADILKEFDKLDVYSPYDNLYPLSFAKSAEIIKENFPYITIALVKPKNDYSPEDYVCVIDLEKGKYGQCKMI